LNISFEYADLRDFCDERFFGTAAPRFGPMNSARRGAEKKADLRPDQAWPAPTFVATGPASLEWAGIDPDWSRVEGRGITFAVFGEKVWVV